MSAASSCTEVQVMGRHMCQMIVNDKHITALLDSDNLATLIKAKVIVPVDFQARWVVVSLCTWGYSIVCYNNHKI